jgi:hypothetical protein
MLSTEEIIFCEGYKNIITEIGNIDEKISDGYCYVEIITKLGKTFYSEDGYYHPIINQLFFNKRPYDEIKMKVDYRIRLKDFNIITYYEGYSDINEKRQKIKKYLEEKKIDSEYVMEIKKKVFYAII